MPRNSQHAHTTQRLNRCAVCGSTAIWDAKFPPGSTEPEGSWYCPKCGVWTAPSDGKESARIQRYTDIALPIVISLLSSKRKIA